MSNLRELLTKIYGKGEVDSILSSIDQLIAKYKPIVPLADITLDHSDVLMICYGDQVHLPGHTKLSALKRFTDRWLSDSISKIHILPFYPYSSDDGFSVIDYYQVNPDLGTWSDVQDLARDYQLMFDGVINHISQESKWLSGYLNNDPKYEGFFKEVNPEDDFSQVTRPRTSPVFHEYRGPDGTSHFLWSTFSKDQVDLNYETPALFLQVLDVLLFYLSQGAHLIRLDAIGFMWKEAGTTCIHLPEAHWLIQSMRLVLEEVQKSVVLISETNVPHNENITYFGNGHNEAKMVYNFTLPPLLAFSLLSQSSSKFSQWVSSLELPSREVCFFNFTASHDGVGLRPVQGILSAEEISILTDSVEANEGFISYKTNSDGSESPYELNCNYRSLLKGSDGNPELAIKRFLLSQALMLSMPGLPAFYFHSLVGSENYTEGVKETGRFRTINREKLDLNQLEVELNDSSSDRHVILNQLKNLIAIRSQQPAFDPFGDFEVVDLGSSMFCLVREHQNPEKSITCLFNFTQHQVAHPFAGKHNLISEHALGEHLGAFEFAWILG